MSEMDTWYIVKQHTGECVILSGDQLTTPAPQPSQDTEAQWGPYTSKADAIARRVGLIRAGKCKPL